MVSASSKASSSELLTKSSGSLEYPFRQLDRCCLRPQDPLATSAPDDLLHLIDGVAFGFDGDEFNWTCGAAHIDAESLLHSLHVSVSSFAMIVDPVLVDASYVRGDVDILLQ